MLRSFNRSFRTHRGPGGGGTALHDGEVRGKGPRCFAFRIVLALASLACLAGCAGARTDIVYGTEHADRFDPSDLVLRSPWGGYEASPGALPARWEDAGSLLAYRKGGGLDFYNITAGRTAQVIFAYESRDRGYLYREERSRAGNGSAGEEIVLSARKRSTLSYPASEHSGEPYPAKDAGKYPPVGYGTKAAGTESSQARAAVLAYGGDLYGVSGEGRGSRGYVPRSARTRRTGKKRDAVTRTSLVGVPGDVGTQGYGRSQPEPAAASRHTAQYGTRSGAGREAAKSATASPGTRTASPAIASLHPLPAEVAGAHLIDRLASPDRPLFLRNEDIPARSAAEEAVIRMPAAARSASEESEESEEAEASSEPAESKEFLASEEPGTSSPFTARAPTNAAGTGEVPGSGEERTAQAGSRKGGDLNADVREGDADTFPFLAFLRDWMQEKNRVYRDVPAPRTGASSREDRDAGAEGTRRGGFYAR